MVASSEFQSCHCTIGAEQKRSNTKRCMPMAFDRLPNQLELTHGTCKAAIGKARNS